MLYWRVVQYWVQHCSANQRKLTQVDRKWTLDMREIYGLLRLAWTCKGKVRTDGPQSIEGLWRDKMTADRSGLSVFNSNFIIGQLWNSLAFKVELLVKISLYVTSFSPVNIWVTIPYHFAALVHLFLQNFLQSCFLVLSLGRMQNEFPRPVETGKTRRAFLSTKTFPSK